MILIQKRKNIMMDIVEYKVAMNKIKTLMSIILTKKRELNILISNIKQNIFKIKVEQKIAIK